MFLLQVLKGNTSKIEIALTAKESILHKISEFLKYL